MNNINKNSLIVSILVAWVGSVGWIPVLILPVIVGGYVEYLGFSEETAGWIATANLAGMALSSIVLSFFVHRWHLLYIALVGVLILISADLVSASVSSSQTFIIVRLFSGIGMGTVVAAALAAIAHQEESDRGFGLFMMLQNIGSAVGVYYLPQLMPEFGIQGLFYSMAGLAFLALLALPVFRFFEGAGEIQYIQEHSQEYKVSSWHLFMTRPIIICLLLALVFEAALTSVWVFSERMGDAIGLAPERVGASLGVAILAGVAGSFFISVFGSYFGRIKPLVIGVILSVVAIFVLSSAVEIILFTLALSAASFIWSYALPLISGIHARLDHSGRVVVAGEFMLVVGATTGSAVAASLVGDGGYTAVLTATVAFYVVSLILLLVSGLSDKRPPLSDQA